MYIKNKRGQSTVEYVLLVTAVLAVLIAFLVGNGGGANSGALQNQLNSTLNGVVTGIGDEGDQLSGSHTLSNAAGVSGPSYNVSVNPS